MDKLAKIAALAAGFWLIYRWMQPSSQPAAAPASAQPAPAPTTPAATTPTPVPAPAPGLVRPASATAERYTADEWNWFIQQITGTTQPTPETFGFSRDAEGKLPAVTWDEYRAQRAAAGLAGLVARHAWRI